jgi:hypothetical protein
MSSPLRLVLLSLLLSSLACSAPPPPVASEPKSNDTSRKRLEVVVQLESRIASRPEPRDSAPVGPTSVTPRPDELSLVWPLARGFGAVLARGDIVTRGSARKVPMSAVPGDFLLEKDVAESALGSFEHLRGRALDLYGKNGIECTATVTGFRVVGGFTSWDAEEAADSVWESLAERFLVAVVEPTDAKCRPLWARAGDLPKPTVLKPRELSVAETHRATRALGKTTVARALQASYREHRTEGREPHGPPTWDALEPREWRAVAFEHPVEPVAYFSAELSAGEGCGDFGGYALGFFKSGGSSLVDLTGDGSPELPERPLFGLVPAAAVVLEAGGPVFFVHPNALYANAGGGVVPVMSIGRTGTTCGC